METDAQRIIHEETDDLHGRTEATSPETKTKGTKSASVRNMSRKKSTTKRTGQTALQKEQRKVAAAQAAVEDLQRRLATVEEALAKEQKKAATAQEALAEQKRIDETRPETQERTAEQMPGGEVAFGLMPFVGFRGSDLFNVSQQVAEQALEQPPLLLKHYTNYMLEMGRVMTGQSTIGPNARDKRFQDEMWKTNPFYHMYLQSYLTWEQSLGAFIDDADLDKKDAESGSIRPLALRRYRRPDQHPAGQSGGHEKDVRDGRDQPGAGTHPYARRPCEQWWHALSGRYEGLSSRQGAGSISPGAVVFKNEVLELIQYTPSTQEVYGRPLLIVPPQVNKFYVMEPVAEQKYRAVPGRQWPASVRHQLAQSNTRASRLGVRTYDQATLEAIDVVRAITKSPDVNIVGSCLGGMTLATLLGHLAAREDQRIHAVTFLVTVLDTNVESTMGLFATKETIAAAREASRLRGVLEGQEMARVFAWLRPNDLIWNYWVNNYLIGKDPAAFDVLYWNNDTTRLPARLHGELLDLYETNAFTHPSALEVLGTPIDLSKVTNDTYIVAGITQSHHPLAGML